MSKLDHALDAASRGLPVFPQEGKVPKIRRWPDNATLKPSVIERWWTRWPEADIGIALPTDIYVLDADSLDALRWLAQGGLPPTLRVKTARGEHRYFRIPYEIARMTEPCEGKGRPGPVTWAGSVHPSGHVYTILDDLPIAWLPITLVQSIGPRRQSGRAGEPTSGEVRLWAARYASMDLSTAYGRMWREDAAADLRLCVNALRCELPDMTTGWADRFYRAGAYLGGHVSSGGLNLGDAIGALEVVFRELDTDGGDPEHVLRSIRRGIGVGAREQRDV